MSNRVSSSGSWFHIPVLTPKRTVIAFSIAVAADAAQVMLVGIPLADQVIDLIAMILTTLTIGFHPLLLPTFILELVPIADMLPTWTACVGAIVFLRRRSKVHAPPIQPTVTSDPTPPQPEPKSPPKLLASPK